MQKVTGIIITYAQEKQYGFIKGDNGKDYFFHRYAIDQKNNICEEDLVHFEQKVSPRGYSAINIKYVVPKEVYISKY